MNYNKNLLRVRREFIDTLRNDVGEAILNTKNIDKKELNNKIRKSVYTFIFRKVSNNIDDKKDIENYYWELFYKTVDFVMDFGCLIINTLSNLREYVEMDLQDEKREVDA